MVNYWSGIRRKYRSRYERLAECLNCGNKFFTIAKLSTRLKCHKCGRYEVLVIDFE